MTDRSPKRSNAEHAADMMMRYLEGDIYALTLAERIATKSLPVIRLGDKGATHMVHYRTPSGKWTDIAVVPVRNFRFVVRSHADERYEAVCASLSLRNNESNHVIMGSVEAVGVARDAEALAHIAEELTLTVWTANKQVCVVLFVAVFEDYGAFAQMHISPRHVYMSDEDYEAYGVRTSSPQLKRAAKKMFNKDAQTAIGHLEESLSSAAAILRAEVPPEIAATRNPYARVQLVGKDDAASVSEEPRLVFTWNWLDPKRGK